MDVFVTTYSQDHYTLYHNTGNRLEFSPKPACTPVWPACRSISPRGAAYADFDNDGDIDVVYTNLDAMPTLRSSRADGRVSEPRRASIQPG